MRIGCCKKSAWQEFGCHLFSSVPKKGFEKDHEGRPPNIWGLQMRGDIRKSRRATEHTHTHSFMVMPGCLSSFPGGAAGVLVFLPATLFAFWAAACHERLLRGFVLGGWTCAKSHLTKGREVRWKPRVGPGIGPCGSRPFPNGCVLFVGHPPPNPPNPQIPKSPNPTWWLLLGASLEKQTKCPKSQRIDRPKWMDKLAAAAFQEPPSSSLPTSKTCPAPCAFLRGGAQGSRKQKPRAKPFIGGRCLCFPAAAPSFWIRFFPFSWCCSFCRGILRREKICVLFKMALLKGLLWIWGVRLGMHKTRVVEG